MADASPVELANMYKFSAVQVLRGVLLGGIAACCVPGVAAALHEFSCGGDNGERVGQPKSCASACNCASACIIGPCQPTASDRVLRQRMLRRV